MARPAAKSARIYRILHVWQAFYRDIFRSWLEAAEKMDQHPAHAELVRKISRQYQEYIRKKDSIIEMYRSGDRKKGEQMHWDVRNQFFELNRIFLQPA